MAVSFNGGTLCDAASDSFDGHFGLQISAVDAVQNEAVIGAADGYYKGRGNSIFTVSFSARKSHASVAAAIAYCATQAIATRGTATFSGFGLSLTNATCQATVKHESGIVTLGTYTITGSQV